MSDRRSFIFQPKHVVGSLRTPKHVLRLMDKKIIKHFHSYFRLSDIALYQLPLILTALLHVDLINVAYLMACAFIRFLMTLHFFNDVDNDAESTQNSKITS